MPFNGARGHGHKAEDTVIIKSVISQEVNNKDRIDIFLLGSLPGKSKMSKQNYHDGLFWIGFRCFHENTFERPFSNLRKLRFIEVN